MHVAHDLLAFAQARGPDGGAGALIVLLDSHVRPQLPPRTLSARAHRPAYGSDGDYFSKPNREQIVRTAYQMMAESNPARFPPGALG